ncbi:hypothetical protein [Salininema proteolyticum]|uniref:DUF1294 domain-containing protein n=1 Tax=Salininema proteolyticum TaxID=1607685 RepID=A0ABV8TXK7_9ACTN
MDTPSMVFGMAVGFAAGTAIWTWRYANYRVAVRHFAAVLAFEAIVAIAYFGYKGGWQA